MVKNIAHGYDLLAEALNSPGHGKGTALHKVIDKWHSVEVVEILGDRMKLESINRLDKDSRGALSIAIAKVGGKDSDSLDVAIYLLKRGAEVQKAEIEALQEEFLPWVSKLFDSEDVDLEAVRRCREMIKLMAAYAVTKYSVELGTYVYKKHGTTVKGIVNKFNQIFEHLLLKQFEKVKEALAQQPENEQKTGGEDKPLDVKAEIETLLKLGSDGFHIVLEKIENADDIIKFLELTKEIEGGRELLAEALSSPNHAGKTGLILLAHHEAAARLLPAVLNLIKGIKEGAGEGHVIKALKHRGENGKTGFQLLAEREEYRDGISKILEFLEENDDGRETLVELLGIRHDQHDWRDKLTTGFQNFSQSASESQVTCVLDYIGGYPGGRERVFKQMIDYDNTSIDPYRIRMDFPGLNKLASCSDDQFIEIIKLIKEEEDRQGKSHTRLIERLTGFPYPCPNPKGGYYMHSRSGDGLHGLFDSMKCTMSDIVALFEDEGDRALLIKGLCSYSWGIEYGGSNVFHKLAKDKDSAPQVSKIIELLRYESNCERVIDMLQDSGPEKKSLDKSFLQLLQEGAEEEIPRLIASLKGLEDRGIIQKESIKGKLHILVEELEAEAKELNVALDQVPEQKQSNNHPVSLGNGNGSSQSFANSQHMWQQPEAQLSRARPPEEQDPNDQPAEQSEQQHAQH